MEHTPWTKEPDSADFEAHGLKCALRRGPVGAWCGYVGIPKEHPLHGRDYDEMVKTPKSIIERKIDVDKVGAVTLFCAGLNNNDETLKAGLLQISLALDCHGGLTYAADKEPCGETDGLWWFGFDAAHCDDITPNVGFNHEGAVYRDEAYMRGECESLAKQLSEWALSTLSGDK